MVRTRFAPSPTGFLHIGGLRTAAYAFAMAKHSNGQFILRIEDTDQKREIKGATEKIYSILKVFGLNWDQLHIQSERVKTGIYNTAAQRLLSQGHAFYCQCEGRNAKADGFSQILRDPCRDLGLSSGAIKLKVPDNQKIWYHDFVLREDIRWDSNDVSDVVLLKSDGFPTYHLAMAVDDHDMQITHVIRSGEWQSSTPIHVLIFDFLGYELPKIGHPTAILDPAGGKLSKRKNNVSCEQFLEQGYLPEALLNFVILLGWAPKNNQELFTLNEFVSGFTELGFQKSNPKLDTTKLDWFNGYYIRQKSDQELVNLVHPFFEDATVDLLKQIIHLAKERVTTLKDFKSLCSFFIHRPSPITNLNSDHLHLAIDNLQKITWSKETIDAALVPQVKARGWKVGDFFMTIRLSLTGSNITPPTTESMLILGKEETLARLKLALAST